MTISILGISLLIAFYLIYIFATAWFVRSGRVSQRFLSSPLIYVLALGVSLHTWTFFSVVPIAGARGYGYLGYYIGFSLAFMLAPVILRPILIITKTHQLSSLADLISFRFRSPAAGTLTAVILVLCMLPFLALQISNISAATQLLVPEIKPVTIAALFCVAIFIFTWIFGVSESAGRDRHQAIISVIAIDTILKLVVLIALGLYCIYSVFGGFGALDEWVKDIPVEMNSLYTPFYNTSTTLVLLLFFSAALAMPYMFHVTFRENSSLPNLKAASWGLPLIMLLASVPVLPIMWAYVSLRPDAPFRFAALSIGIEQGSPLMTLMVYLASFSAACGVTIVSVLTLANISLNHLVYPLFPPSSDSSLPNSQVFRRRLIYAAVLASAFALYYTVRDGSVDSDLGYLTFVAGLQFLPAIIAVLFWPQGNRKGVVAGILVGVASWALLGLMPFFSGSSITTIAMSPFGIIDWVEVASLSFTANMVTMVVVSLLTRTSEEERYAGYLCSLNTLEKPRRLVLTAKCTEDFILSLTAPLGKEVASREVHRALSDLDLLPTESRPYPMQLLRDQLESNLSGLFGPTVAWQMIDKYLPYELINESGSLDISFLESKLDSFSGNLSEVADDLDRLRRHHRQTLLELPVGIITIDGSGRITLWNKAVEQLTDIKYQDAANRAPLELPAPWSEFLVNFIHQEKNSLPKTSLQYSGSTHWLNLHKTRIEESANEGLIIVVEDLTENRLLEQELVHSERLASIGSLAAGVAHEIGNPVTAIACLAQNVRDEASDVELKSMAEKIIEQTRRTSNIVQSLVDFAHSGDKQCSPETRSAERCCVRSAVEQSIELVKLGCNRVDVTFSNECQGQLFVKADRQRLQQVIVNLLTNARDASPVSGNITVTESSTADEIELCVTDEGSGILQEHQERVFEPFFTTKEPGKGTGLGLSLVFSILEEMGARVRLKSPLDPVNSSGTSVFVTFSR